MLRGTIFLIVASILWGILHSWLASHGVKDFLRRTMGFSFDHLYRLAYNLFAASSLVPIFAILWLAPDTVLYRIPEPWIYLTTLIQGGAAIALIAGVMQTGPLEFIGLTQLTSSAPLAPPTLVTDGLYAYVRHPLYAAGLLFIWFTPEMTVNRLVLWTIFSIYIVVGALFEEKKLGKDFGPAYAEYCSRTSMLIPRFKRSH